MSTSVFLPYKFVCFFHIWQGPQKNKNKKPAQSLLPKEQKEEEFQGMADLVLDVSLK